MILKFMSQVHIPVMPQEVLENLLLKPGMTVLDATIGEGGHAARILEKIMPQGLLIGIDQDMEAIAIAREKLKNFSDNLILINDNFHNIGHILTENKIDKIDAMLFDLGVSSLQLEAAERGFSFRKEGPLNMRMDTSGQITAYDLVNNLSETELAQILRLFGEERFNRQIARSIAQQRKTHMISTTLELADIVSRAVPKRFCHMRIHPATRTFQALRIAVNRELEVLPLALETAVQYLNPGARLCVISFHSLEDRIVKNEFRKFKISGMAKLITKKPLIPMDKETRDNVRSRSAKMRVLEKI